MLACKGSAEVSFFACAAQQSLWHCMEACHALVSVRGERRKTDESAALSLPHTRTRSCCLTKGLQFQRLRSDI